MTQCQAVNELRSLGHGQQSSSGLDNIHHLRIRFPSIMRSCDYLFILFVGIFASSTHSVAAELDYETDIAPIFEEHCLHCHGDDEQESGLRLDRRASMLRGGDSGLAAVVPHMPEKSYLLEVINHVDKEMAMPPEEEMIPRVQREKLKSWIAEGANWPGQMGALSRQKSDHWSFQKVAKPSVPKTNRMAGNAIDAFLLNTLESKGLTFSQVADPRTLVRRAAIVLTGLPPTPEMSDSFMADYRNNGMTAYGDLVERLLESPHFGERWAQHWLDVIRWAETNGSESNMYRKNAWIYRDYVVRAFNEDKPYDRFLFEQIAGDTVGQGDATGYLVAGSHVPVATVGQEPSARRQARADRMDEILQTVGASALGVTIGCARCHNHKFDPISIQDYYSMAAVFQGVEFGSRFPELAEKHPRRVRGQELYQEIAIIHDKLKKLGAWEENWIGYKEFHFPATETSKIRITFNWNGVRLDELEIFGPGDPKYNLALAENGANTYSPPEMAVVRAQIERVNDGEYGTQAWGCKAPADSKVKPYIEISFPNAVACNRLRLSTNREDYLETDYLEGLHKFNFGGYRVEAMDSDGQWKQVASTMSSGQQNQRHAERAQLLQELEKLIAAVLEEGPMPSFVARFIKPVPTHVLGRGSPENPRERVLPAGPEELGGLLEVKENSSGRARRTAFANWLAHDDNPLTARVAVNRIWHHIFGRGIVSTTSDFGAAGGIPSHPQLLDWLASEFMNPSTEAMKATGQNSHPWSMKHMIRLMVMSQAFQQKSEPNPDGLTLDANAELLWRFPPKRLEAEVIRDGILQASGKLQDTLGGRSYRIHNVKKRYSQWQVVNNHGPDTWRRMLYQERMRRVDDQMFTAFDFPDCGQVRARRPISTTPLQALNLMNSDFVVEQSKFIAERAKKDAGGDLPASVKRCFELVLGRPPTPNETEACVDVAESDSLQSVCRALINSNEFAFLP